MSNINIKVAANGYGSIAVDGVNLPCVTGFDVKSRAGEMVQVVVGLMARQQDLNLEGASLVLAGVEMPQDVEYALLTYLTAKYPLVAGVEQLQHTPLGRAASGKAAAPVVSEVVVRELVAIRRLLQRQEEVATAVAV
jgi:hypothetical protein